MDPVSVFHTHYIRHVDAAALIDITAGPTPHLGEGGGMLAPAPGW